MNGRPLDGIKHSAWGFRKYGCRCEVCREAKSRCNARNNSTHMGGRRHSHFCPACPLSFYTEEAYKAHYKQEHAK